MKFLRNGGGNIFGREESVRWETESARPTRERNGVDVGVADASNARVQAALRPLHALKIVSQSVRRFRFIDKGMKKDRKDDEQRDDDGFSTRWRVVE